MITIRNDDFPDIERDMKIIANKRLDILKDAGLADPKSKGADIGPFLSPPRGYLLSGDNFIMMFEPDAFDFQSAVDLVERDGDASIEFWILADDTVIDFGELDPPEEE